ncbi:MAG: GNAT family N-acetyltransferase [Bacillaceae bacterium]
MLTNKQLNDIKNLQMQCEEYEPISLKLNWDMLKERQEQEVCDFFHYEDEILVGFIGVYGFGTKYEICGMVHPTYRRKGIFTALLQQALNSIVDAKKILLNAPANSQSGVAFIKKQPCTYAFSEYQMCWKERSFPDYQKKSRLRVAEADDFSFLAEVDVECFGFGMSEAIDFNERNERLVREGRSFYIIEVGEEKVGKIAIQQEGNETWIYGFGILQAYRGKGYGKEVLIQVINTELKENNSIHLEVDSQNEHAKRLYEKCGFVAYDTQIYYVYHM